MQAGKIALISIYIWPYSWYKLVGAQEHYLGFCARGYAVCPKLSMVICACWSDSLWHGQHSAIALCVVGSPTLLFLDEYF